MNNKTVVIELFQKGDAIIQLQDHINCNRLILRSYTVQLDATFYGNETPRMLSVYLGGVSKSNFNLDANTRSTNSNHLLKVPLTNNAFTFVPNASIPLATSNELPRSFNVKIFHLDANGNYITIPDASITYIGLVFEAEV